jgi:hypothetical protein
VSQSKLAADAVMNIRSKDANRCRQLRSSHFRASDWSHVESCQAELGAQGFSSLAHDVEVTGVGEKAVPSLPRSFFHDSDSHQVIERYCNCGNRELKSSGRGGDISNRLALHVFVDA